jgi:hypothetical protein
MRPVPSDDPGDDTVVEAPTYQAHGRSLRLPAMLPGAVARAFASSARARLEAGALLYGVRGSGEEAADEICALVVPEQEGHAGRYHVPHAAIAAASATTRDHGWVTLGQVHSHPGRNVEHSWYDDRHAVSVRAISLVLPFYGANPRDWPDQIGVHEYQDGWWHLLTTEQVARRITFTDLPMQVIDLRHRKEN